MNFQIELNLILNIDAKPGSGGGLVNVSEEKLITIQNSIDNLKVLFTQVLERINIVNQENNFLRTLLLQNQGISDSSFAVIPSILPFPLDATNPKPISTIQPAARCDWQEFASRGFRTTLCQLPLASNFEPNLPASVQPSRPLPRPVRLQVLSAAWKSQFRVLPKPQSVTRHE